MGYSVFSGIRRLHLVDLSSDAVVASSSSHTMMLTPGVGEIYEVLHVYVSIPAIAGSSGDHELECFQKLFIVISFGLLLRRVRRMRFLRCFCLLLVLFFVLRNIR